MQEWWRRLGVELFDGYLPREAFSVEEAPECAELSRRGATVEDGALLCGCFLYVMETKGGPAGLVAHTISNPDRKLAGYRGVELMMSDAVEYAASEGFVTLMCLTTSRFLASVYEKNGFVLGQRGFNEYILV